MNDPYPGSSSNPVLKGCLIMAVVFFALLIGSGLLLWYKRDTIGDGMLTMVEGLVDKSEIPEYGRQDYIDQRYGNLLRTMDAAADASSTIMIFGAAVQQMDLPDEVLYVGVSRGDDDTDVIKNHNLGGHTSFTFNRYGYGTLGGGKHKKPVMIYKNNQGWPYMDEFTVYFEHTGHVAGAAE